MTAASVEWRGGARALLELAGLSGVAVAQPVLAVFGDAPDWFVFHGATRSSIITFALAVAVVPPLALWAVIRAAGSGSAFRRRIVQSTVIGALAGLVALQLSARAGLASPAGVAIAVAAAIAAGLAHTRWATVRLWTALLSPAPLLFAGMFLFSSPVSGLVHGDDIDAADLGAFGSGDPPPVVVLVLDEWPLASIVRQDGTIDADLYPNVAELAAGSTWYRDTTTVANLTNFAVPALLTGNRPEDGASADAASHPENLFTLLGGTYRLDVTERITRLCPTSLCNAGGGGAEREDGIGVADLLAAAADVYADRLTPGPDPVPTTDVFVEPDAAVAAAEADSTEAELDDLFDRRPETLNRYLERMQADEEPTFHFLHLLAPHTPYRHLPDGHQYAAQPQIRAITAEDGTEDGDRRSLAAAPALLDRQRLQLEVAHVDRLIGDVLDRLHETDLYDDALLVVTSDHGIAFAPGAGVRGLGAGEIDPAAQPELLWVPLFVKAPGQEVGEVVDTPAETIDVVPTIADRLGIELPWGVDGRSLDDDLTDRERLVHHVQGSSFATFHLDDATELDTDIEDVFARGVDTVLRGEGPDRWWRVGPRPDLLDRPPRGDRLPALLDDAGPFLDVDLDQTEIPAVVSGRVAEDIPRVAVVVNGLVSAIADTYSDRDGGGRFTVIVSPDLLDDGVNRIAVHRPLATP